MANKELTFGCLVKTSEDKIEMICSGLVNEWTSFAAIPYPEGRWCWFTTIYHLHDLEWVNLDSKRTIKEIVGHPMMIGDVLEYIIQDWWINATLEVVKDLIDQHWWNYNTCIDDQSDECIDYVYSLIGNKNE